MIGTLIPYLTALRIESGLTTRQAARLAGLSGEVVKKWEVGRTTPTLAALELYTAIYGLELRLVTAAAEALLADAIRLLELEAMPARPPHNAQGLPPITSEVASANRRRLAEALHVVDHDLMARGEAA